MNFTLVLFFAPILAFAQTSTPIKNFHPVDTRGYLFRGAQPGTKVGELKKLKFDNVLIIKKQNGHEVDTEVERLRDLGIRSQVIPMEWKHADVKVLCHQVVEAVHTLQRLKKEKKKTFFHCTLGQDRTGAVAGLFKMVDQGWSASRAFREEMCGRGYSDGAPGKPASVTREIEKSLTPIFLALSKSLSPSTGLNASACNRIQIPVSIPTCRKLQ